VPKHPTVSGGGESVSLYSGSIGTHIYSGLSHYGQESAIGKALWHQVTTVVILLVGVGHCFAWQGYSSLLAMS
jgi:hypothetical protein